MELTIEKIIMELVVNGGNARSCALEAIGAAKAGNFLQAQKHMQEADAAIEKAHSFQTEMIQSEAGGQSMTVTLLMVHAQDHLMNAMTVRDLAKEFIDLYERMEE